MPSTRTISRKSRARLARDETLAELLPPDLCVIVATDKCGCPWPSGSQAWPENEDLLLLT